MVYGSAELYDIPWELIIKSYRKTLGTQSYPTLNEYIEEFLAFIPSFFDQLSIETDLRTDFLFHFVVDYFDYIQTKSQEDDDSYDRLTVEEQVETYTATANRLYTEFISDDVPYLRGISEDDAQNIKNLLSPIVHEFIDNFSDEEEVSTTVITDFTEAFSDFCFIAFAKINYIEARRTGLVFAGYGENEYLPQIQTYEVLGLFNDRLRCQCIKAKTAKQGDIGIIPFAQQAEVEIFMQGISNPIKDLYEIFSKQLVTEAVKHMAMTLNSIESLDEDTRQEHIITLVDSLKSSFSENSKTINEYINEEHIDKVIDMIQHLPKNELAYMAESLVNLTAFKRKVSNDNDTVGGPIDVAVISKGDGFVWVKRKHYFPEAINKHYLPK